MKPHFETWWTLPQESAGGISGPVLVRSVPALCDLEPGECTFVEARLEELKRDERFHPLPGTPGRSYRHRMLNEYSDGGRVRQFWMRLA